MRTLLTSALSVTLIASSLMAQEPQSVRNILGNFNPIEHTKAQIRVGYINLDNSASTDQSAVAVGGHLHLDSKRYSGIMAGASLYTVQDMGINSSNLAKRDGDFWNKDLNGYSLLSEAFLDGKWKNTEIKIGRQILDTPHADSDDLRMIPNYFLAYVIRNNDIDGLTLNAAKIDQMAGWENGVDSSKFIKLSKVLGLSKNSDGAYMVSAVYEGIENLSLQLWGYKFDDLANVIYTEVDYSFDFNDDISLNTGLQYDKAKDTGDSLNGNIDSNTYGASMEIDLKKLSMTVLAAFDKDNGSTGAFGSLGGGPFFTSLEDQTLDAVGARGYAWIAGASYDFSDAGINGLSFGAVYGKFKADDSSSYNSAETDMTITYDINDKFNTTAAFASINDKTAGNIGSGDYRQFRVIANYNF